MNEKIKTLRELACFLELQEFEKAKDNLERDLKIIKLERGIETLQRVIKDKDDAYTEIISALKNSFLRKQDGKSSS